MSVLKCLSKSCSPWIPTSRLGKAAAAILGAVAITLLVIGILATQSSSTIALSSAGAQAMMGVGGAILVLYFLEVLLCRCKEEDGFFNP